MVRESSTSTSSAQVEGQSCGQAEARRSDRTGTFKAGPSRERAGRRRGRGIALRLARAPVHHRPRKGRAQCRRSSPKVLRPKLLRFEPTRHDTWSGALHFCRRRCGSLLRPAPQRDRAHVQRQTQDPQTGRGTSGQARCGRADARVADHLARDPAVHRAQGLAHEGPQGLPGRRHRGAAGSRRDRPGPQKTRRQLHVLEATAGALRPLPGQSLHPRGSAPATGLARAARSARAPGFSPTMPPTSWTIPVSSPSSASLRRRGRDARPHGRKPHGSTPTSSRLTRLGRHARGARVALALRPKAWRSDGRRAVAGRSGHRSLRSNRRSHHPGGTALN